MGMCVCVVRALLKFYLFSRFEVMRNEASIMVGGSMNAWDRSSEVSL